MTDTYELTDGVEANRLNPDSYYIPSPEEKALIGPGMLVKLGFTFTNTDDAGPSGERMWVLVLDKDSEDDGFLGVLQNVPIFMDDPEYGDLVEFESKHVIDIDLPSAVVEYINWSTRDVGLSDDTV